VKISRLGWSLSAAAIFTVVSVPSARAQEVTADSATHTVKKGDTLWDLANFYLGDAYLWPEIYRLNTDQIEDPHWIYPGEVLRLPTRARGAAPTVAAANPGPAPDVQEAPRRTTGPTVFTPRTLPRPRGSMMVSEGPPPRVNPGDFSRAPYFTKGMGPKDAGTLLVGADIPGIDKPNATANFQLYDRVLMSPPKGSALREGDRFIAYREGDYVEGMGTVVIPTAILRVVRPPQDGDAAMVEVRELYGQLNSEQHVVPLDTTGSGATEAPVPISTNRSAKIQSIVRESVLPSLDYYVLFDMKSTDGMKVGDEVEIYRPRTEPKTDIGPAIPEVAIATGQVVRVTPYGATARVTSQQQPAIRIGESVRVTARMP
jgi:LysM repeat protein